MAAGLIQRAGGNARLAIEEVDKALAKIAAVSGGGAQATPGLDNDAVRVLDSAEQIAGKAGDSFVSVQRMLQALALSGGGRRAGAEGGECRCQSAGSGDPGSHRRAHRRQRLGRGKL